MAADARLAAPEAIAFDRLKALVASGKIQFVASLVHLWEIAAYGDASSNEREARLIDSLSPRWIELRICLIEYELLNAFHAWRGEPDLVRPVEPFLVSLGQYGAPAGPAVIIPGQDTAAGFVQSIWTNSGARKRVSKVIDATGYVLTVESLRQTRRADRTQFMSALENARIELVRRFAPIRDRNANFTSRKEREEFALQFRVQDSPSLWFEQEVVKAKATRNFTPRRSEQFDTMYAESSVPYLDVIVTDRQFCDVAKQAARRCPPIRARCFSTISGALDSLVV